MNDRVAKALPILLLLVLSELSSAHEAEPSDFIFLNYSGIEKDEMAAKIHIDAISPIADKRYLSCTIHSSGLVAEVRIHNPTERNLFRTAVAIGGTSDSPNGVKVISESRSYTYSLQTLSLFATFPFANGNRGFDNDASPTYPCNIETGNVICVANVERSSNGDIDLSKSNWGVRSVDLAAFGYTKEAACGGTKNKYGSIGKTSGANAHISKVAADVLANNYSLGAHDVRRLIIAAVSPLEGLSTRLRFGGILNQKKAIRSTELSIPLGNNVTAVIEKVMEITF